MALSFPVAFRNAVAQGIESAFFIITQELSQLT